MSRDTKSGRQVYEGAMKANTDAVLARRLKHAREVKARKRKVAEYMKGIVARQPELRAAAEARLEEERRRGQP